MSHALREPLVGRVGERPFRGIYAVVSLLTFGAMVYFYHAIGREPERLWDATGDAAWIVASLLMWFASILFVGSFIKNPAFPGAPGPKGGPTGVFAITRHPMMWGFAIWAAVHLMANGDTRGTVFFASILAYSLVDLVSAVQRHATKLFAPTARHDAIAVAAGIVASLAVMALHRVLFGAAVVSWGF